MNKLLMGIALLLFISCSNTSETDAVNPNQDVIDFLTADGFDTKDAKIIENDIIVEGDIAFDMDDLRERMKTADRDKQWRTQYLVSQSRIRDVRVRYASNMSNAWRNKFNTAMGEWNAISNSKLRMRRVTGSYDIYVRYGQTASAYARFPTSNGRAGNRITVGYNTTSSGQYGRYLTAHELGHCIGFRHDFAYNEGGVYYRVPGTPYSDYSSIMGYNYQSAYFTYNDKKATRTLYPR